MINLTIRDAPTMQTDFYFFFGLVEVTMKAASGTGIVSSIVMESDDLDEFDWVCSTVPGSGYFSLTAY